MLGKSEKVRTLLSIFQDHNRKIAALADKDMRKEQSGDMKLPLGTPKIRLNGNTKFLISMSEKLTMIL
jgi:hypothetical protein